MIGVHNSDRKAARRSPSSKRASSASTRSDMLSQQLASMTSNDDVERRGVALSLNEADLSQSSIPSLAHRSCGRDRSNRLLGASATLKRNDRSGDIVHQPTAHEWGLGLAIASRNNGSADSAAQGTALRQGLETKAAARWGPILGTETRIGPRAHRRHRFQGTPRL